MTTVVLADAGPLVALFNRHDKQSTEAEKPSLLGFMRRYADVPVSLADACLVRLAEIHPRCRVWTLDADFHVYRRHGRQTIPVLLP